MGEINVFVIVAVSSAVFVIETLRLAVGGRNVFVSENVPVSVTVIDELTDLETEIESDKEVVKLSVTWAVPDFDTVRDGV